MQQQVQRPCGGVAEGERERGRVVADEVELQGGWNGQWETVIQYLGVSCKDPGFNLNIMADYYQIQENGVNYNLKYHISF